MTKEIEAAMENELEQLAWMSDGHQEAGARSSCTAMVNKIGYPDKWRDYSSVNIVPRRFCWAT